MICVKTKDKRVIAAATEVAALLESERFYDFIRHHGQFDMSNMSSDHVAMAIEGEYKNMDITVETYTPWNPWSAARAMFKKSKPRTVHLSSRKLHRSDNYEVNKASLAGSIIHEIVHLVDNVYKYHKMGHGNNKSKGKENTAPYWIGRMAKDLLIK